MAALSDFRFGRMVKVERVEISEEDLAAFSTSPAVLGTIGQVGWVSRIDPDSFGGTGIEVLFLSTNVKYVYPACDLRLV